jgi:hypothetical protein
MTGIADGFELYIAILRERFYHNENLLRCRRTTRVVAALYNIYAYMSYAASLAKRTPERFMRRSAA